MMTPQADFCLHASAVVFTIDNHAQMVRQSAETALSQNYSMNT